jgi:hypothetical protein
MMWALQNAAFAARYAPAREGKDKGARLQAANIKRFSLGM